MSEEAAGGRAEALLRLIGWQCGFGPRYPGAPGHRPFIDALREAFERGLPGGLVLAQDFTIDFRGAARACTNLIAVKHSASPSRGPLLLGAHFDSRAGADNEPEDTRRGLPIPGANDGGSGVAVLLDLLPFIARAEFDRDVHIVLFDAEDVGGMDGLDFAEGARFLAAHPLPAPPEEVVVLDLVGGRNAVFDVDLHALDRPASLAWTREIHSLATRLDFTPLLATKPRKFKHIVADHYPFHELGIPAFVFIDIDYPEWHTLADAPAAVSGETLAAVEDFVKALLEKYRVD
ncbi:MAG: M28 family peptidase [Spirochaetales bacterium]|nr:M28 family peptidase [Spirochaetales bacterium]